MIYGRIMLKSEIEDLRQQEQVLLKAADVCKGDLAEQLRTKAEAVRSERSSKEFQFAAKAAAGLVD